MTSWSEFRNANPHFAAKVARCFTSRRHHTMATLRANGSPRISGTEVEIDDEFAIGSMAGARKAADLLRDPRVAIHSATVDPPAGDESAWAGEAKVAGRAVPDPEKTEHHRFVIDVEEVVFTTVAPSKDALVIEMWHPDRGYEQVTRG